MIKKSKKLYIIPGLGDTTEEKPYFKIKKLAEEKGYEVIGINPNWEKSLSEQVFEIQKNSVIFGFSLGGVLAQLIAMEYPSVKIILASSTTHLCADDLKEHLPPQIIEDVRKIKDAPVDKAIVLYGEREKDYIPKYVPKRMKITKLIKNTGHELSEEYIKTIIENLSVE